MIPAVKLPPIRTLANRLKNSSNRTMLQDHKDVRRLWTAVMERNPVDDVVNLSPRVQKQLNVMPAEATPELVDQLTQIGAAQAVVLDRESGKTLIIENPEILNMLPGNAKRYMTGHELVHAAQNLSPRLRSPFQQELDSPVTREAYIAYQTIYQRMAEGLSLTDPAMRTEITEQVAQIRISPQKLAKLRIKTVESINELFHDKVGFLSSHLKGMSNEGLAQLKKMILNEIQAHTLTKNTFTRGNQILGLNDVGTIQLHRKIYGLIKTEEYQRFVKAKANANIAPST